MYSLQWKLPGETEVLIENIWSLAFRVHNRLDVVIHAFNSRLRQVDLSVLDQPGLYRLWLKTVRNCITQHVKVLATKLVT